MWQRVGLWFTTGSILFVLWLLYADSVEHAEILAALGGAALGATATEVARGADHPRFFPHIRWILQVWRLPGEILRDCLALTTALGARLFRGAPLRGRFYCIRFDPGGDDSRSAARRAIAVTYATLPPNSTVVGFDREAGLLLIHQAVTAPTPPVLELLARE